jgi:iron complex outermembrane receptor protein
MEQLLDVELVYAAALHAQSLRDAPSAVTVVTAEQIRRQGYRTLGDVLRALPSFFVTYDRNYTYVGVRGFGRPGDYNTRILLLLNGVRLNDNIYDAMYVGHEALIDIDLVERVEVVRGPAASLYGNSAFFAVVNVITRRGGDLLGGEVSAAAGTWGTLEARATYGRKTSRGLEYLVSASAFGSDGPDLFFPEFAQPQTGNGRAVGLDGEATRKAFASASGGGFSAQAVHSWRRKDVPTASFGTEFGDPRTRTVDQLSQLALQYERRLGRTDVMARAHYGRYSYLGRYPYPEGVYADAVHGEWVNVEGGVTRALGSRHLLTLGTQVQWNARQDQHGHYLGAPPIIDVQQSGTSFGLFAQDEVRLSEALRLHAGLRHDTFGSYGRHTSPRLALVHTSAAGTVKLLYGNAFRAPNAYELHYYPALEELRPETIRTFELVWERPLGRSARASVSVFDNRIANLLSVTGEVGDFHFENHGTIRSRGVEAAGEWRSQRGARARGSYSFQKTSDVGAGGELTNSPHHLAKLELEVPVGGRIWAGASAQHFSRRLTLSGGSLPAFTRADLTLTAPRLVGGIDLSAGVYNLFDTRYADPGSEEHVQDALAQDGRSLRVKLSWRF